MTSQYKGSKVGFPIRRFLDQSSFAAPQDLSQRTTSFIASQRQGIHQMLLRHLITLMINVRSAKTEQRSQERPVIGFLRRHVFACQAYPALLAAGQGWFAGTRCPACRICCLFTISNIRATHPKGRARTSFDIPEKIIGDRRSHPSKNDGGACRDRTDDLKLAKLPLSQLS